MTVPEYQRALPFSSFIPAPQGMPRKRQPLYQRLGRERYGLTPLQRGKAVYVAYNQTTYPGLIPARLLRLARKPKVRRVVLDLRQNGGGDNTSYGALLAALRSRTVNRPGKLVVLTSRVTFSAAGNFAADIDHSTRARFVGEPTGGSPNNYGDAQEIQLPTLGVSVFTPTQWVEAVPGDDSARRRARRRRPADRGGLLRRPRPRPGGGAAMTLTATEAALLGLLRHGEQSGYDLRKLVERSVGYYWTPAKTQIYSSLPRLVESGLATRRTVRQTDRPDKHLYAITDERPRGRERLDPHRAARRRPRAGTSCCSSWRWQTRATRPPCSTRCESGAPRRSSCGRSSWSWTRPEASPTRRSST